jgi:AcrR family transcriptional regulator
LLEAAARAFAGHGYTGATIDLIAQESGYSKGAIYHHFPSKEHVFLEVLWARAREEEVELRTAAAAEDRPLNLLRAVAGVLGDGGDPAWSALLLEFWSHSTRNPRVSEGVAAVAAFRREVLHTALERAAATGVICPALSVEECADLLLTLGDGLLTRVGTGQGAMAPGYLPSVIATVLGVSRTARPRTLPRAAQAIAA